MIFAAGFGARMQYYTKNIPKSLLKVGDKCLLDIVIDRLIEYGVENIVVNCHYLADQLIAHLKDTPKVTISYEDEILETGGGLVKALPILGMEPLITVNADTIWYENDLLLQLTRLWQNHTNSELAMTFCDSARMLNHKGEFNILDDNSVIRNENGKFVYAGIQVINPTVLQNISKKHFSLSELHALLLNKKSSNVYGMEYTGAIFHVGSVEELKVANLTIEQQSH